jgi:thiamine-phosphate pyrophosphorylase
MIDRLHYISQPFPNGSHLTALECALEAGCKWVQLRIKNMPHDLILKYATEANKICNQYGAKLIVNDHPGIALEAGAHGIHLGLEDMPIAKARAIVGKKMIIGGTANTFQHIEQRAAEGVDYIGLGPYRFTHTKQNLKPILGLQGYKNILQQTHAAGIDIPIIAVGGILLDDIDTIMQTGVYGIAASSALTFSKNRKQLVKQMYQQLHTPISKGNHQNSNKKLC